MNVQIADKCAIVTAKMYGVMPVPLIVGVCVQNTTMI